MRTVDESCDTVMATIVLAEDDSGLRRIYAEHLRRAGHVVWEAADGGQALALVRTHAPDVLLLDIWLPILNGLEVLEQLAGATEGVGLQIVVLSHQNDSDTSLEVYALGVVDYWTKDLPVDELGVRIERMMRQAPTAASQTG
jgi:DNA-binding response OmpR family regulator